MFSGPTWFCSSWVVNEVVGVSTSQIVYLSKDYALNESIIFTIVYDLIETSL